MDQRKPVSNLSTALASINLHDHNLNNNNFGNDSLSQNQSQNQNQNQQRQHQHQPQPQPNQSNERSNGSIIPELTSQTVDRIAEYRKHPPSEGITLFSHRSAPNGFKVAVVLVELGIKFKTFYLDLKKNEQRSPYYVSINPNARIPAIIDHDNGDHSVWESGAILIYLCQKVGPDCPLWSEDYAEQSMITSWLFFQASGHAPMVGQALHFRYFHPENITSAIERYTSEVRRIYSVVEMRLAEKREQLIMEMDDDSFALGTSALSESKYFDEPVWLVGNRITIADLSFVTWNHVVDRIGINLRSEFPEVYKWTKAMMDRPAVIRALSGLESN